MSIRVDLQSLAGELASRPYGYLLTVSDEGRPHAVAVAPRLTAGRLEADTGARTSANAAARPDVSFVFPPTELDGYSLIVDGTAHVDGVRVRVAPLRAVLHRPAPAPAPSGDGCGSDCVELAGD